jgi:crotonobetaine/carnitine-CoA ligase
VQDQVVRRLDPVRQAHRIRDVVPVAYIVARDQADPPTADDLAVWAGRQLAPQARPREWQFIDSLPRTSVGTVGRFKIGNDRRGLT